MCRSGSTFHSSDDDFCHSILQVARPNGGQYISLSYWDLQPTQNIMFIITGTLQGTLSYLEMSGAGNMLW